MSHSTHSTYNSLASSSIRKRPRRMRVKKYNVDVSNSISSIDMSGRIEYGQDYSSIASTSMDRSTLQNIGKIHLASPGIPSQLTKMDRKIGSASPGIDPNIVKNLLPENPSTQGGSKSTSASKSPSVSKLTSSSEPNPPTGANRIRNENLDSMHARFSLSSDSSSSSSSSTLESSSSSGSEASKDDDENDDDGGDEIGDSEKYALPDLDYSDPVVPQRKSAPSVPSSPSSPSSASSASTTSSKAKEKYKFPNTLFKKGAETKDSPPYNRISNSSPKSKQNSPAEARASPIITDDSTDGWYVDSHDDSTNVGKRQEQDLYGKYQHIYNRPETTTDALPSMKTDEDENDQDTIRNDNGGATIENSPTANIHETIATAKDVSNKDENTTTMPMVDGDDSNDAQNATSNEEMSIETKRSLDRERRFQVWLEHGIYLPATGSVAASNESKSESSSSATVSEAEDKDDDPSYNWWNQVGSVLAPKKDKPTASKAESLRSSSSERGNNSADADRSNEAEAQADPTDFDNEPTENQSDEEESMDRPEETTEEKTSLAAVPAISEDEIYMTEKEEPSITGGSFADMVAARSRARMNKTTEPQRVENYDTPHQAREETSVPASGGSLADQIAAAARSRKKNPSRMQSSEEYDKPYQTKSEVKQADMSLADQIAAAAKARKTTQQSTPRTEEDYDKQYEPKKEVESTGLSIADQVAAAAKSGKLKSTPKTEEDYDKLYEKSNHSADTSLADQVASMAVKLKSRSAEKTEEDYDYLYDRSRPIHSMDTSLADQVAAASKKVKLKNQAAPKTEEDYNKLYDSKKARQSADRSLADQVAAAAKAVKTTPMTEEDYNKLYDPKKEIKERDALANQIAAAAIARRRNKSEEDFEAFYQKPEQEPKNEPQLMFKLKPVEHRRTRAQRYFQQNPSSSLSSRFDDIDLSAPQKSNTVPENPESFEADIKSIASSQKSNKVKDKPDIAEDDIETSDSSTHTSSRELKEKPDFEDIEASISSRPKSSTELKGSFRMNMVSPTPTKSPPEMSATGKRRCCWRPFLCCITITFSLVVLAAFGIPFYFFVFAKRDTGSDNVAPEVSNNPVFEATKLPTVSPTLLPLAQSPTNSIPIAPSPMPSFRRSTNRPTIQPTFKPTLQPTQEVFQTIPTIPPTMKTTIENTTQQTIPIQPTNLPITLPTHLPTIIKATLPPTSAPTVQRSFPTGPPTTTPTVQPVIKTEKPNLPTETPKVTLLRAQLVSRWPSLANSLNTVGSPQRKAFEWLIDSGVDEYAELQLTQRFVMATFFFSTNGSNWSNNDGWLSPENECNWYQTNDYRENCDTSGNLLRLDLEGNGLSGSLPSELALLSNTFNGLDLGRTKDGNASLRGPLPSEIGLLTKLEYLNLNSQEMTGTLPYEIGQLSLLNVLDLGMNIFQGTLPSSLGNLRRLYNFYLGFNNFSGAIPPEVGDMQYLVNLDLQQNLLSSSLPSELGNLLILQSLSLGRNDLTGTIPTFLGELSNLGRSLYLNDNRLSGTIPTELGQLTKLLSVLDLSSNKLSGPIPTELDSLVRLGNLQLQKNLLTGTIPSSFSKLSELRVLQLEFNNLIGSVSPSMCDALVTDKIDSGIIPTTMVTDCLREVDCECCQYCCAEGGGCKCQFANTDKEFLCAYGNVLGPQTRLTTTFDD